MRTLWGTTGGKVLIFVVCTASAAAVAAIGLMYAVGYLPRDHDSAMKIRIVGPVSVEVDMFSGRTNPQLTLAAADADDLARRLGGLNQRSVESPVMALGYRGYLLRYSDQVGEHELRVFNGAVVSEIWPGHSRGPHGSDDGRVLEQWLFDRSSAQLDVGVRQAVAVALRRPRQ